VACDLYDGCLLVDGDRLTLIDLDTYHRGPFVNTMGRMFGSTRYMAPEEFDMGATIDLRTTVFTLGRLIWHLGTGITEDAADFCGTPAQADVGRRALAVDPDDRWADPAQFAAAWRSAGPVEADSV
jgi:serine/threonine-protein kinase